MQVKATTADAYRLWHRTALTLSRMSRNGMAVDRDYLRTHTAKLGADLAMYEDKLRQGEVWSHYQRKFRTPNLSSRDQLTQVVFREMGYPQTGVKTGSGKDAADEAAFRHIDLPWLRDYFAWQKLHKLRTTYFAGILREIVDGVLHTNFNLITVQSYRGSSSEPNVQNIPARQVEIMRQIRQMFVPRDRENYHVVETDAVGAEVRVSQLYNRDPVLGAYIRDKNSDMHGDTAEQLFDLPPGFVKQHAKWAKRTVRDWAKNRFVFPQFYGSVYFQCAPHIWEAVKERDGDDFKHKMPDGQSIYDYLKGKGITSLGHCLPKMPASPGTFEYAVRRVERQFWNERFPVYTRWKEATWQQYLRDGYIDYLTGFRASGVMRRNQVLNYQTQGTSFHILAETLNLLQEWIDRYHIRALLICQIHDSIIAEVHKDDLDDYLTAVRHIMTRTVPSRWKWIDIPLEVEAEVCPVGASWDKKEVWTQAGSADWAPQAKA